MTRQNGRDEDEFPEPSASGALIGLIGAQRVTAQTFLRAGQLLEANWDERWWPAEVIQVLADGRVSIHYSGWPDSHDEIVPRSRLRLTSAEFKTVSVVGEGFSQTGLLVDDIENFLVLETPTGANPTGAKLFINKHKIIYFEIVD